LEWLSSNIGFSGDYLKEDIFAMLFIYNTTTAENSMNIVYEGGLR